jgi:hypothetical protein
MLVACGGDDSTTTTNPDASTDGAPLPDGGGGGDTSVGDSGKPPFDAGGSGITVLEHHNHGNRDGVYVDAKLTKAAVANMHLDTTFVAKMPGSTTYTQPLYAPVVGKDAVIVATEQNVVYAFSAADGATLWKTNALVPASKLSNLPCGNIDPLGITGTPVIDVVSRTIYLDAMTGTAKNANHHKIFALSLDDGSVKAGWPVDVDTALASAKFDSNVQNQRGALTLLNGKLYVPYGGFYGDCGGYHGWLVGVDVANPTSVTSWATPAQGGGAWCAAGVSTDGTSLFITTGNTFNTKTWQGGDAVVRLTSGTTFSNTNADYFAPKNWLALDNSDLDMGTHLLVNAKGATPSSLVLGFGKDGNIYVTDHANMGGVGGQLSTVKGGSGELTGGATTFSTSTATYVSFRVDGGSGSACPKGNGNVGTVLISGTPPTAKMVWCSNEGDLSLPTTSMTDANGTDAIVWSMSSSDPGQQSRLYAYDGVTGTELFAGGGNGDVMTTGVRYFNTPMIANGKVYVAANGQVFAFTP